MVESRWFRRAGPAIAALGAIAFIVSTTLGAPDRPWLPATCAGPARVGDLSPGTWFRIDPTLEAGARTGQRLVVGSARNRRGPDTRPGCRVLRGRTVRWRGPGRQR